MLIKMKQKKNRNYLRQKISYNIYTVCGTILTAKFRKFSYKGPFIAKFVGSRCAFTNFEWVFRFRESFELGAEFMQITMQRTRPAWPAKTKLRMTLDCSRIAKEIAMISGHFVGGRRQTLLYS